MDKLDKGDKGIDIREYFAEHAPEEYAKPLVNMASSQMWRAGAETMDILCNMTVVEIIKTRNIGEKSRELVLLMRKKYATENQIALK